MVAILNGAASRFGDYAVRKCCEEGVGTEASSVVSCTGTRVMFFCKANKFDNGIGSHAVAHDSSVAIHDYGTQ